MKITTFLLPDFRRHDIQLANDAAIMIDVLRAGTTVCAALSNGAIEILPCESIEEAVVAKIAAAPGSSFLGGERKGVKPEGFDAGNSPLEYGPDSVNGKTVVLTTSNGTRIFRKCGDAKAALAGAFVNLSAVTVFILGLFTKKAIKNVSIFCAGSDGRFSYEDAVCAGAFIGALGLKTDTELCDSSLAARNLYRAHKDDIKVKGLPGKHVEYLKSIGFEEDIRRAFDIDSVPVVPIMKNGRFVLAE